MSPKKHTLISWDFPLKTLLHFYLYIFPLCWKEQFIFTERRGFLEEKHFLEYNFHSSLYTSYSKVIDRIQFHSPPKYCLTLNTFICQRKVQIKFKKTTFKKCANVGRGKCAKSWRQNPQQIQNNSAKSLHQRTCMELQKKKTYPVG